MNKIQGLEFEPISEDPYFGIWRLFCRNPFEKDGNMYIGINEKLLRTAHVQNVKKFIVQIGGKDLEVNVPQLDKLPFEEIPSKFENGKTMKIYHVRV